MKMNRKGQTGLVAAFIGLMIAVIDLVSGNPRTNMKSVSESPSQ
jgi:hypothetical protein